MNIPKKIGGFRISNMGKHQNLENLWMPFSANRSFKARPRLMNEAKGVYYKKIDGTSVLDGTSGLWCCNAGHNHPKIVKLMEVVRENDELFFIFEYVFSLRPSLSLSTTLTHT